MSLSIISFYILSLILIVYFYSKFTARTFLKPMQQLINGTKKIADGDYSSRITINVNNEFGELKDAFNMMAEKIDNEIINRNSKEKKLVKKATIDEFTGIYNRSAGLEILEHKFKIAKKNNDILSICFIDLNNLKYVNDRFGHNTGDEYIKKCVETIKKEIREKDIFMRLGGDEFLIVFTKTSYEEAEIVWQRIKNNIDRYNENNTKEYELSMSHGIETLHNNNFYSIKKFIDSADIKMYKEKKKIKKLYNKLAI
ncbi:GGDEF domain-containing protein [Clostridium ganghwense]|nr:GGDEF domain-containing protein [Clostridium ganghwense]